MKEYVRKQQGLDKDACHPVWGKSLEYGMPRGRRGGDPCGDESSQAYDRRRLCGSSVRTQRDGIFAAQVAELQAQLNTLLGV